MDSTRKFIINFEICAQSKQKKLYQKYISNLVITTPFDFLKLIKYVHIFKYCKHLDLTFSDLVIPDIVLSKIYQLSKTFHSIKLKDLSTLKSKLPPMKKLFYSNIKTFKFQIEEVPLSLIQISSRSLEFLSFSFYYTGFDFYRQKIIKILDILKFGPKKELSSILIKIDGLKYDAKFISTLYLASMRLKRRPLQYFINLNYQDTSLFEEFGKLDKKIRFHLTVDSLEEKSLYAKNINQITSLQLKLHHTNQKNFFDLVPHLQTLSNVLYMKVEIFTLDSKSAFESFRFPLNLIELDFSLQDGNQKDPQFTYTIQELRGNTERKLRACNLIDRVKQYNSFLDQFKILEKLKKLRFSVSSYFEVHHIYVLFLYALSKRLIVQLISLAIELKKVETQKQYHLEYADVNLPTILSLLTGQSLLKSFELYTPEISLDGFRASKMSFSTEKLSFSPHILRTNIPSDPIDMIKVITNSRLEYLELFRLTSRESLLLIIEKTSLLSVKYLSLIFEIEEQLRSFDIEDLLTALMYKSRLKILRVFMLYQKFGDRELEKFNNILMCRNSVTSAYVQLGASILRKV